MLYSQNPALTNATEYSSNENVVEISEWWKCSYCYGWFFKSFCLSDILRRLNLNSKGFIDWKETPDIKPLTEHLVDNAA